MIIKQNNDYEMYKKKYCIDESVKFNGNGIRLYGDGEIIIGKDSYIGELSFLQSALDHFIQIGENCAISHNVKMYTTSYKVDQNFDQVKKENYSGNIIMGNGVWMGANVYHGPWITILNNAVIRANSVVKKGVPENAVCEGIPTKFIKQKKSIGH
jgi:maltose O-acetyltransferase